MSKRTCLTCKYEPEWSQWSTGKYARCHGTCNWPRPKTDYPACYRIEITGIIRYRDDSGIKTKCKVWEPKA